MSYGLLDRKRRKAKPKLFMYILEKERAKEDGRKTK